MELVRWNSSGLPRVTRDKTLGNTMSMSATSHRTRANGASHAKSRRPAKRTSRAAATGANSDREPARPSPGVRKHPETKPGLFTIFAQKTAQLAGRPATFILAVTTIVVWAVTGPLFGYSDTWQLVINTGTTIVTFLMVFLIQNSQNRDSLAFQIKLDELIIAMQGAENRMAGAEDLCDADLEALHDSYRKRASEALDTLEKRRASR
jgi:low affinity Fe/Cu permease